MYVQVPRQRPSTTRQRAAILLLLCAAAVVGALFLPWARPSGGIYFGEIERLPPDGLTAWQWYRGADVALAAVAALLGTVGVALLLGRRVRAGLAGAAAACAVALVFVASKALDPGLPDFGPGLVLAVATSPGSGVFVAAGGLAGGLIVASVALARSRRRATV